MAHKITLLTLFVFLSSTQVWASDSLSYSGRLVNANGSPVTGQARLRFDLAYTNDLSDILCTKETANVDLVNGVFHVKLAFDCSPTTLYKVLEETPVGNTVAIRVTDLTPTPPKVYSFQALHSIPYAMMSNTAKQLVQMGATNGQVLTWNGVQWVPSEPVGIADGGVTAPKLDQMGATSGQVLKWSGTNWAPSSDLDTGVGTEADPTVHAFARNDVTGIAPEVCTSNQVLHYVSVDNSLRCFDLVNDAIVNGETNKAASQNAVFDALALKQNTIDNSTELMMNSLRVTNDGSTWMGLKAPSAAGNLYFTLPGGVGLSGQMLITDGAGNLSWVTPTANSTSIVDGSIVDADIATGANIAQSKIAGLDTSLTNLQNSISGLTTDNVAEGTRLYFAKDKVLGTDLLGLNTTNGPITSADTVLSSIGKMIGNLAIVSSAQSNYVLKSGDTMTGHLQMGGFSVTGLGEPSGNTDAATKKYVDDVALAGSSKWTKNVNDISYTLGNVGIGTSEPGAKLHVGSTINSVLNGGFMGSAVFSGTGAGGANKGLFVVGSSDIANGDRPLVGSVRTRGTLTAPTAVQNGDQLFSFLGAAFDGSNLQYPAMIDFNVDGAVSAGVIPASIDFFTGTNAGNRVSRMRVTSSGNIGIGTISPDAKLDVYGGVIEVAGSSTPPGGGDDRLAIGSITGSYKWIQTYGSQPLVLNPVSNKVGIGTTSPNERLSVEGTVSLREVAAPTATANYGKLYIKTDSKLYFMNDSGVETVLGSSDGGTPGDNTINSAKIVDGSIVNTDVSATASIDVTKIGTGVVDNTELSYLDGATSNIQTQIGNLRTVPAGSDTSKYLRGDNTWQNLDTSVVPETISRQYFTQQRVLDSLLSGYAGVSANAVSIGDGESVITSLKKLQMQITANDTAFDGTGQWSKNDPSIYYNGGNVGIGTSSPQQKFVVQGGNAALNSIGNATPAYEWRASDNSLRAYISHATETVGATADENRFYQAYGFKTFYTQGSERVRIDANGKVGIGTSSPVSLLEIAKTGVASGTESSVLTLRSENSGGGAGSTIDFWNGNSTFTSGAGYTASIAGIDDGVYNGRLEFRTNSSGSVARSARLTSADAKMVIKANGNVGIGTNSPQVKLDVNGTVKATAFNGPGILLQFINLSAADFVTNTSDVWADVPNLSSTFTTSVSTVVDVVASGMYRTLNSSVGNIRLVINGVEVAGDYIQQAPSAGTFHSNTSINWAQSLAAGTHTIKVQWRNENATGSFDQGWNDNGRVLSRRLKIMVYSQ